MERFVSIEREILQIESSFLLLLLGREEEIKMKEKIKKGINSKASFVLATWKLRFLT
ncbi:unnamed protein product [Prunus brigantina]